MQLRKKPQNTYLVGDKSWETNTKTEGRQTPDVSLPYRSNAKIKLLVSF